MDFNCMGRIINLFKKKGGWNLIKRYACAHVLFYAIRQLMVSGVSNKSLELLELSVENKILSKLRKKYNRQIKSLKLNIDKNNAILSHEKSNFVWFCWFQGIDNAPDVVKECYNSICRNLENKRIIVITEDNYCDYIDLPDYLKEKYKRGYISKTHLSDIIRLQLLIKYGGIWIDATVYCSGKNIPEYMINSDLFLFQNLKPGLNGHATCISSWYINSCKNNKILILARDLLFEYWKRRNILIDYFLLHDFIQLAIEVYPKEWNNVMPVSNSTPHIILLRLFEQFDENIWEVVTNMTPFHKFSYKFEEDKTLLKGTYYQYLFK